MTKPILHVFSISHYCEKAKWALDYLGIDYEINILIPGLNAAFAKKLGVNKSSLPILSYGDEVIQGSSQIIDWAEQRTNNDSKSLTVNNAQIEAEKFEQRLDNVLGVHVRRMFYSESLLNHPKTVRPVFSEGLSFVDKIKLHIMWPMIIRKMTVFMDLGDEQRIQSTELVDAEIKWLDELLSDGRSYLFENKFSRVDITAASLLARVVSPVEHPAQNYFVLPPQATELASEWSNRPTFKWVLKMYAEHRL